MMSGTRGWISFDARRMDLYIYILPLYVYGVCVVGVREVCAGAGSRILYMAQAGSTMLLSLWLIISG